MRALLSLLGLLAFLSCDAPGPLKADRDADDLFGPSEDNVVVVDAILIVDAPLPYVDLRRTAAPGLPYWMDASALIGARVAIRQGETVLDYLPDESMPGRYLPPAGAPLVEPATTYELQVSSEGDPDVRATTTTPPRVRIVELALMDDDLEVELKRLKLFDEIGDGVYQAPENQLEFTVGALEARLQLDGVAASYQFGVHNLENASPLLFDSDFVDDVDDLDRTETSPLLRPDGETLFLPWEGMYYAGRQKVKLFAVDRNWFDLVRTDNVDSERETGEAGQGFQRPLFNVENGIGLFGSASVDSIGFFVRRKGSPPCTGCDCWGCGDRSSWSGILDTETGSGRLRYERDVGTGATCELSYEIVNAGFIDPCPTCFFAWEFDLGEMTVYRDSGACNEAEGLEGTHLLFAQGSEVVGEEGGVYRHGLYIWSEGFWDRIETGWSVLVSVAEEQRWLFGMSE